MVEHSSTTPAASPAATELQTIEDIQETFRSRDYITRPSLATATFLALELGRPLLLEGEAGVGKTELAKVLAASLGARLIRLQCYEGLDVNTAVYEWNYPRQMLEIRLLEARGAADRATSHNIFGPEFLIKRPLLQALEATRRRRAGAAHRRDRPRRRGVRGVPARDPVGLPGHDPRARHDQGREAAARDPDLEPDARGPRRAEASLPLPLDRLPDAPEGVRDRLGPGARRAGTARPRGRRVRPPAARGRPDEGPGHRRDARLGGRAALARRPELSPELVDESLGVVLKYEEDVRAGPRRPPRRYLAEAAAATPVARLDDRTTAIRAVVQRARRRRAASTVGACSREAVGFGRALRAAGPADRPRRGDRLRPRADARRHRRPREVRARRRRDLRPAPRRPRDLRPRLRAVLAPAPLAARRRATSTRRRDAAATQGDEADAGRRRPATRRGGAAPTESPLADRRRRRVGRRGGDSTGIIVAPDAYTPAASSSAIANSTG